jgi:hypothetical protein
MGINATDEKENVMSRQTTLEHTNSIAPMMSRMNSIEISFAKALLTLPYQGLSKRRHHLVPSRTPKWLFRRVSE